METISGKIIRILDKRTVIINLGKDDGVTSQSIFSIMGDAEEIIDPDTEEVLGKVTIVKTRVKAKEVAGKFTIATTKWASTRFKSIDTLFSAFSKNMETIEKDEGDLSVDESEIQPWKAKSESPVKVGDIVQVKIEKEKEQLPQPLPEIEDGAITNESE